MFQETYTITFGDVAENHVNMEKLGSMSDQDEKDDENEDEDEDDKNDDESESDEEEEEEKKDKSNSKKRKTLNNKTKDSRTSKKIKSIKKGSKEEVEEVDENEKEKKSNVLYNEAYLLIIRNGLSAICDTNEFHKEQKKLEKDKKAFMYGRVVNKTARHNLCFIDGPSRDPDYEKGMGRVVSFNDCPLLKKTRETFKEILNEKCNELVAEGNYYYDINKCGIGWHGDAERSKVIAIRTGASMKICFNWFLDSKSIGTKYEQFLNHGDIYVMSEFAVGNNWKKKKIPTLRHSAGSPKYTSL
ncbi:hypothetical protein DLAC_08174 [Tieghemostelium lacteum]|uniref:Alpha-ketoglutarate-dependent dioxygenase AlkB-like domain-containing protein n=1 Tax=Tieghemostelium lacteum TaxID=361077 RepID=A0A151ZBI6_TIELA|nr:hypothetical protein DLAC_08174 [Tieghemostelium lacteum]|eukprot:KYQ91244.1 hypothetical protein DLAC_08174 [Tieghemostelium lacteum]